MARFPLILRFTGRSAPPLSKAGEAAMYYDAEDDALKLSKDGGAYAALGAGGDYTKPALGIPSTDMTAAVQTSLGKADTAYQKPGTGIPITDLAAALQASLASVRTGKVTLNGINPTKVAFTEDAAAIIAGTAEGPFALDNGLTLVVDPDGAGDDTVTFAATAATSVSDGGSTDISGETDSKFLISVDGSDPTEVDLAPLAGLTSGTLIAAAIEAAVQALGGVFAAVTCGFADTKYTITSGTKGTGSSVVVTDAPNSNIAEELKLGKSNGGIESPGTGDAANIGAATAEEVAAAINAAADGWSAEAVDGRVVIVSEGAQSPTSLVVNAASTADEVLGITGSAGDSQGLGYDTDMADADYRVLATPSGATAAAGVVGLSTAGKTPAGFDLYASTDASTLDVDLLILGTPAS